MLQIRLQFTITILGALDDTVLDTGQIPLHLMVNILIQVICIFIAHIFVNLFDLFSGVIHHDELLYLFLMHGFPLFNSTDPEIITVERWTTIYSHFAETGHPIPENDELFDRVKWERYTPQSKLYLDFNKTMKMKDNYRSERMSFWDNLFPVKHLT